MLNTTRVNNTNITLYKLSDTHFQVTIGTQGGVFYENYADYETAYKAYIRNVAYYAKEDD